MAVIVWGSREGGKHKEGREKALLMAIALRIFLSEERQANPAEVWLLDDGTAKLPHTPPGSKLP